MSAKPLSTPDLDRLRKEFSADATAKLLQNALTAAELKDIALDREVLTSIDTTMSHRLDDWSVTNQKQSGRCWLFAGLNLLRAGTAKKLGVKDFEFSQNHAMFFDKMERANYFLQSIVDLVDRETDDRTLATLLQDCMGDGGQWNMFVAVIAKHGLVPKSAMPETISSSGTRQMNSSLRKILHTAARDIRVAADPDARAEIVETTLSTVWRALCMHLGTPPDRFFWQWTDADKQFHRDGWLTPQEFRNKYLTIDPDDYVCLVHDPRNPVNRTYTVELLGNVVGAPQVVYLNVDVELMKKLTAEMIIDGSPVWFGCDVGQMMDRERGFWDARLLDLEGVYNTRFTLDKAARLEYHQTMMTHAMLFTGVDLVDGAPRKWRVENSWGEESAEKGFYTMNDSWYSEYVFEIAAPKSSLPPEVLAALDTEPVVLPAWDPMGALAGR
ncbi:aminopeptidase C [Microlunatus sp. Gsoil 973]|uniref:aminopeptidase C n=1 Tax=Microlunatus sp. Gsoil 973 TaxID=2672569 RepID=UPI0012B45B6A|nr:C1 family peptidase [Microlunatus sp. Gsoil 973]QGN33064.1 aminopeptidase [Microlunatus sp. Gsoil 973]